MKFETLQSFEVGGRLFAVKRAGVKEVYEAEDSVAGNLIFQLLLKDGKVKVLEAPAPVESEDEVPADETVEQAKAELAELLLLENPSKAKLKKIEKLKAIVGE